MRRILPSLLSADFYNLEEQLVLLEEKGIEVLHLDVMDGDYVPNITFGAPVIKSMRPHTDLIFDAHLMVSKPERYLDDFIEAGCDWITVHPEATVHLQRCLQKIKDAGKKAGIALNPHTDFRPLQYIMDDVDLILVMSVNPGFSGQAYIPAIDRKIQDLRLWLDEKGYEDVVITVDGGVKPSNILEKLELGADLCVAGSAVFGGQGIKKNLKAFEDVLGGKPCERQ